MTHSDRHDAVAVNHDGEAPVPSRPAATVMLIRDAELRGADDLEVFVLERTVGSAFAGGFYVFPGGVVDAADGGGDLESICRGRSDADASAALGIERGGLAYWVAAVRECFEEAAILLAGRRDGARFEPDAADRHAVHDGELSMAAFCQRNELLLDVADLRYVAHWVTPEEERPRRFDTRFFLAPVTAEQARRGLHDDVETVSSRWVRPAVALEQAARGDLMLLPPTVSCLEQLAESASVTAALAVADAAGPPPRIMPTLVRDDAGRPVGARLPDGTVYRLG